MGITNYIVAIVLTSLLALSFFFKIQKREIWVIVHTLLCLVVSVSWSVILVNEVAIRFFGANRASLLITIISTIISVIIALILMILTWREPSNTEESLIYTPETLIGLHGTIVEHDGNDLYYGILDDKDKSQIYVHIISPEAIEPDTKFVITSINGSKIYAEVVK